MKKIILLITCLSIQLIYAQQSGYYMNWNIDHTERSVKPSIKISEDELQNMYGYYVEFDNHDRLQSVKFFFEGKKSNHGNYGTHELERFYFDDHFIEKYKNTKGEYVSISGGIDERKYLLNTYGYWIKKENYSKGNLVTEGVAYSKVTRNIKNELATEIQFSVTNDTIPDGNGFPIVNFAYDQNGLTLYRQNLAINGKVVNGENGYAAVIFQFNQDGMFFEEQFLDEKGNLFLHPRFDLAKINWRAFNKYGKPARIYYMNVLGYPHEQRAYGKITYRPNMTRESITFYNRIGEKTVDRNGIAKSVYNYNADGKFLGRTNYNFNGEKIK
ncbi:hypothetical protein [Hanstruepera ponticola]|uniref:hypothetical protein n=1 Tax=Hanstruepera ponticola TaxID=2042995 RepID=UPI001784D815|nr:hypothetical protein [Hanstruepera ponticola]